MHFDYGLALEDGDLQPDFGNLFRSALAYLPTSHWSLMEYTMSLWS